MKISTKVGQGMRVFGITGLLASYTGVFYFADKLKDLDKTSPEHIRVAEIERESSKLRDLGCIPVEYIGKSKFVQEPFEKKVQPDLPSGCDEEKVNQYRSLQEERNARMQSSSYLKVEKQKEVYFNHALGFAVGGVPLSLLSYAVGVLAVKKRGEEATGEKK